MKTPSARLLETALVFGFLLLLAISSWNNDARIALLLPLGLTCEIAWFSTSISPKKTRKILDIIVPALFAALFSLSLLELTLVNGTKTLPLTFWDGWQSSILVGIGESVVLGLLGVALVDSKGQAWFENSMVRASVAWVAGAIMIGICFHALARNRIRG